MVKMVNKDKKLALYYSLLRIRMIEEKIAELYPEQDMRCPVHLCIGQEAPAVAVCSNLGKNDYVVSNHRSHGHYLAKGGDLKAMLAEIYGKRTGCSKGFGGSMHLIDLSVNFLGSTPIVGGCIPIAVGAAFKIILKNEDRICAVFLGDAAVEEGIFHESANFASLYNLPVLFICENNLYSVYTPLGVRQPKRGIYKLAEAHNIKSRQLDGNDLFFLNNEMFSVINEMRKNRKPQFVEMLTYRWREHCGPNYDNSLGYRTETEFLKWKKKDPVEKAKNVLYKVGILTEKIEQNFVNMIREEIDKAFDYAKKSQFPTKSSLGRYSYAE